MIFGSMGAASPAYAQSSGPVTYTKTEVIVYHDNPAKWVMDQVAKVTCVAPTACTPASSPGGIVVSETTYDPTYALPLTAKSFGKLQQTLTYELASGSQAGTVKTVKDGNNNVTTVSNWYRGIPKNIQYADASTQSAEVNSSGWITSVTDENTFTTDYQYDAMGRLSRIVYPTSDSTAWNDTILAFEKLTAADNGVPSGYWRQTVSTGNARKIVYLDALWRPVVTREYDTANETGTKRFQRFQYDWSGRAIFASYPGTSDALATGTWTEYDALGRPTSVAQDSELGQPLVTLTDYLAGFQVRTTNPRGVQTATQFQAWDQPTTEMPVGMTTYAGADTAATVIAREAAFGKPTSITRRNGDGSVSLTRSYAYNDNQELCRSVEPETGATLMGYDGAGNLAWSAAGLASTTACEPGGTSPLVAARKATRTYDARNRVKTLVFPDGLGNTTHTYTPDGLPASIVAQNKNAAGAFEAATNSYTYNKRRLLTRETLVTPALNWPADYVYHSNGYLSSQNWHGLSIDYAPNALGQPTQAGAYASGVSYYPNGAIKQFTYGNGIVHTMIQNSRQLPARSTDCKVAGACASTDRILDLGYTFDNNANVGAITDYTAGARQTRAMTYDNLDRLTQTTSSMFNTATYGYNVLDNLTTVNVTGGSKARNHTYVYDTGNRLVNVKNTLGGATVIGLGYDVQGNLNNKNGVAHAFDYGNRLRSVTYPATPSLNSRYTYDGLGRRVQDEVGGLSKQSMYLQNGQLSMTGDGRTNTVTEYVYLQGSLIALRERNTVTNVYATRYQHTDALGTPLATTDASKNFMEKSEYEPYGQLVNATPKDGPGYTGHVMDAATGLIQMQQRYMDPGIGLFLSVDPVTAFSNPVGMFNRYRYAANNPYTFFDPDGRCTGSRITNGDGTCASTGGFTTQSMGPTMSGARSVVHQAAIQAQAKFNPQTAIAAENDFPASRNVFRVRNSTLSMPGMPRIGGMVLGNYEYEHHIKVRHASDVGDNDAGKFYRSILNRTTSQSSFSKFIQDAINTGIITYVGPYGPDPRDIRILIETVPIGTTPSGAPSSTLIIGLRQTGAPGVWYVKTAFPFGL